ncbi:MAG: nitroreductase family protein [Bacteroidales bacterium]|nr:nitroreductase family protein [Bacteroidales bacterium]
MLNDLILKNRSYRKFHADKKVEEETLTELVELARNTPSSKNRQPLKYLLLTKPKDTDFLFLQLKWAWYLKDWPGPALNERPPAYILMLLDTRLNENADIDAGIAAQSILLGAVEKGMGGCIVRTVNHYEVKKHFALEEELKIILVLAIGFPNQEVRLTPLETSSDVAYFEEGGVHFVPKRKLEEIIIRAKPVAE